MSVFQLWRWIEVQQPLRIKGSGVLVRQTTSMLPKKVQITVLNTFQKGPVCFPTNSKKKKTTPRAATSHLTL